MASVLAVVLVFPGAPFTDFSLVLQGYQIASVLFDLVTIGAAIGATITTMMYRERSGR